MEAGRRARCPITRRFELGRAWRARSRQQTSTSGFTSEQRVTIPFVFTRDPMSGVREESPHFEPRLRHHARRPRRPAARIARNGTHFSCAVGLSRTSYRLIHNESGVRSWIVCTLSRAPHQRGRKRLFGDGGGGIGSPVIVRLACVHQLTQALLLCSRQQETTPQ